VCDLCWAELDENASSPSLVDTTLLDTTLPDQLCFGDVLAELALVADLARASGGGRSVVAAVERAERLLGSLRAQFLRDLGIAYVGRLDSS
jgi:hypothetical protein